MSEDDEIQKMPEEKKLNPQSDPDLNFPNESEPNVKGFEFNDESIRRGFIRKVYGILSVDFAIGTCHGFFNFLHSNENGFISRYN